MSYLPGGPPPVPPPYIPTPRGPNRAEEAQARALAGIATFTARAQVPPRHRRVKPHRLSGELLVSPDEITFLTCGSAHTVRLAHHKPTITMAKARLRGPWSSTVLLLEDQGAKTPVTLSAFARRRLRRALRESGVKVLER
jgi:hypothetical protein